VYVVLVAQNMIILCPFKAAKLMKYKTASYLTPILVYISTVPELEMWETCWIVEAP